MLRLRECGNRGGGSWGKLEGNREVGNSKNYFDIPKQEYRNLPGILQLGFYGVKASILPAITILMLLYLRDSSSPPHSTASGSSTPADLSDSFDNHSASSAYDSHLSNFSFQIVYTFSETNPPSLLNVSENIHSNTNLTTSCLSEAMTFILDTPLLIRFLLQEPPPPLLLSSLITISFLASLTGGVLRASTVTPLRYPSSLELTM